VAFATSEDVAIVLQTSGTTSQPKTMPLKHRNIVAVANSFINSLELTENDVCLNVMPMFHYHGLIVAMLSSVLSGGTTVCIGYYDRDAFASWLEIHRPTWYTAVSGIHQDILSLPAAWERVNQRSRLRFIRSSSNALLPSVLTGLEEIFDVPLIESYGVSEAGTLACNPVDRNLRKIGSVGKTVPGIELFIAGVDGTALVHGQIGEIVAKGPAMIDGYEEANYNAGAFNNGWFFTGDLGYQDSEGYLHLKGRVKELIRKGEEAIAPFEIDQVINDYHKVAEGIAFSIESPEFGEDIAAVVVPKSGESLTEDEIFTHLKQHLPSRLIPKLVLIRDNIPKNAIGKPLRVGMSNHLGLVQ